MDQHLVMSNHRKTLFCCGLSVNRLKVEESTPADALP